MPEILVLCTSMTVKDIRRTFGPFPQNSHSWEISVRTGCFSTVWCP